MKIIIKETGERKTLSTTDKKSGVEWAVDLIGNSGAIGDTIIYNRDTGEYITDADTFNWWSEYIANYERDELERAGLESEHGKERVSAIYEDEWLNEGNDYNDHHKINMRAAERCRTELAAI